MYIRAALFMIANLEIIGLPKYFTIYWSSRILCKHQTGEDKLVLEDVGRCPQYINVEKHKVWHFYVISFKKEKV